MKVGDGCAAYHRTARRETPRALTPQQHTGPASEEKERNTQGTDAPTAHRAGVPEKERNTQGTDAPTAHRPASEEKE